MRIDVVPSASTCVMNDFEWTIGRPRKSRRPAREWRRERPLFPVRQRQTNSHNSPGFNYTPTNSWDTYNENEARKNLLKITWTCTWNCSTQCQIKYSHLFSRHWWYQMVGSGDDFQHIMPMFLLPLQSAEAACWKLLMCPTVSNQDITKLKTKTEQKCAFPKG